MQRLFTKLSVEAVLKELKQSKDLAKTLGWFQLIMFGIGAIIGAGVFVYTGTTAAQNAGPALAISFILAGIACALTAFCYAELASAIPVAGSSYSYTYIAFGEFPAWMISGMISLTYLFSAAGVASGWASYVMSLMADFGLYLPPELSGYYGSVIKVAGEEVGHGIINLPAMLLICLLGYVVMLGSETSAMLNTVIVVIKFSVLLSFIIVGSFYVDPNNWAPFIPENTGNYGEFGWSGIVAASSIILLAYNGFDTVAAAAQESKNPKRDVPIGILGALLISMLVYVAVTLVMTGITHYSNLNVAEPIAVAVGVMNMPWFAFIIKIGAIAGLTTVVLVLLYSSVRIGYMMTHDGLLPKSLAVTHKKHKTPHLLTIICTIFTAIISSLLPADHSAGMGSVGAMVTFIAVSGCVIRLRKSEPNLERAFYCPLVPVVPVMAMLLFAGMIYSSNNNVIMYTVWYALCWSAIYFAYGLHHSIANNRK